MSEPDDKGEPGEPRLRVTASTVYEDGTPNVAGVVAADVVGIESQVPGVSHFDAAVVITFSPERGLEMGAAMREDPALVAWWVPFSNHVEKVVREALEAAHRRAAAKAMVDRAESRSGFETGGRLVHSAACPKATQANARCNCDQPVVAP